MSSRLTNHKHRCEFTGHFRLQCAVDRCHHYAFDKPSDDFPRFRSAGLVGVGSQQIFDFLPRGATSL